MLLLINPLKSHLVNDDVSNILCLFLYGDISFC